ncbi:hypothetical protein [Acidithiobacillus ferrivorans]|uniref:Uncharacterized protein n=1 Tax=Acidithiobacillus ferrivorans TaxID=160808 RepID=A0A7T4WFC8_9PROT|nr:hypothetical protein [Acidithiobacillus ferrivorans]QQD73579.1 hypothetical protein H2515_04725 [Acidithiobacillus ferrivorans]
MHKPILKIALLVFSAAAHGATNNTDYAHYILNNLPGVMLAPVSSKDPNPMPKGKQFETEAQIESLSGIVGGLAAFSKVQAEVRASAPWVIEAKEERQAQNAEADAYLAGQEQAQASAEMAQIAPILAAEEASQPVPPQAAPAAAFKNSDHWQHHQSNEGQEIPIINGNGGFLTGIGGGQAIDNNNGKLYSNGGSGNMYNEQ